MSRGPKKKKYNKNKIKRDKNKLCRDIVRIPSNLLALYIYIYIKCTECIYSVCANVRLLRIVLLLARIFFHNHHDLFVPCMYSIYICMACVCDVAVFPFLLLYFFLFTFRVFRMWFGTYAVDLAGAILTTVCVQLAVNMFFVTQFPLILIIRVCKTSTVRASASDNFCDQFVVTDAHASLSLQVEANFDSGSILTWTNSIDICMSILLFSIRIVVTDCVVHCVSK